MGGKPALGMLVDNADDLHQPKYQTYPNICYFDLIDFIIGTHHGRSVTSSFQTLLLAPCVLARIVRAKTTRNIRVTDYKTSQEKNMYSAWYVLVENSAQEKAIITFTCSQCLCADTETQSVR